MILLMLRMLLLRVLSKMLRRGCCLTWLTRDVCITCCLPALISVNLELFFATTKIAGMVAITVVAGDCCCILSAFIFLVTCSAAFYASGSSEAVCSNMAMFATRVALDNFYFGMSFHRVIFVVKEDATFTEIF